MAPLKSLVALLFSLSAASAFTPSKNVVPKVTSIQGANLGAPEIFEDATADWAKQFPAFAKYGWGPSVQAEKWNGRHAMFGWFFICATAYCKGHGLIPDAESLVSFKDWGTLATISGKNTITNERAIILAANAHFFGVSLMATFCPPSQGDTLFTEPTVNQPTGYGYMPKFNMGLTQEAEILNGRLAMLGLMALVVATAVEQKDMLDIVNEWVGGAYF
ncbi:hypothetical protein FisN_3Hh542 [Fistulifera solaris]|uniref:Uncharacterized protein n=1 Tax=Fistulifera solaris TaxID=1519565 RepID=A0A1Z5K2Y0_FISSO|nr:hypothetical protein FisN_3Hh542 [Fistulifera solaris]|eukprot:GAX20607.1 hypothetical protein FisN_3Hh542 [Fistulifera solaris]